jgi:hypothetical protein
MVKQFHDVNEWAASLLMTLEMPLGVKGLVDKDITAQDLREFLNGATLPSSIADNSQSPRDFSPKLPLTAEGPVTDANTIAQNPEVCDVACFVRVEQLLSTKTQVSDNESTVFKFLGSNLDDSPQLRPPTKLRKFGFRHASLPLLPALHPTTRLGSSSTRRASLPIFTKSQASPSFLEFSGETLEDFIRGVEVSENKLSNKNKWLELIQTPEASAFLGKSPTTQKLKQFMTLHGLEWVVRVRGKWRFQSSLQTLEEESQSSPSSARKSANVEQRPCSQTSTEITPVECALCARATDLESFEGPISEVTAPSDASVKSESAMEEQMLLDASSYTRGSAETGAGESEAKSPPEELVTEESSTGERITNLAHVFPWLRSSVKNESVSEPAIIAPVASESAFTSGDHSHNLAHVFVWLTPSYKDVTWGPCNLESATALAYDAPEVKALSNDLKQPFATGEVPSLVGEDQTAGNPDHEFTFEEACIPSPIAPIGERTPADSTEAPAMDDSVMQEPVTEESLIEQLISLPPPALHDSVHEPDAIKPALCTTSLHESTSGSLDHIFVFQKPLHNPASIETGEDRHVGVKVSTDDVEAPVKVQLATQDDATNDTNESDRPSNDAPSNKNELTSMAEETALINLEVPAKKHLADDALHPMSDHEALERNFKRELDMYLISSFIPPPSSDAESGLTAENSSAQTVHKGGPVFSPWSLSPFLAGATVSAIVVSAFCPALTATMLWASIIYTKNKLNSWRTCL